VIFNFEEFEHGEQTDSRKLNSYFRAIGDDVSELYTVYSQLHSNLSAQVDAAGVSNDALVAQIDVIQNALSGVTGDQSYVSLFDDENVLYPTVSADRMATHDISFGAATLHLSDQHIEFLHLSPEDGTLVLAEDIEDQIEHYITNNRFLPRVDRLIENDISRMLDANPATSFITKVFTSNADTDSIEQIFQVTMEANRDINMIKMIPVPELGIDLTSMEIDSPGAGYTVPKKIDGEDYTFPVANAIRQIMPMHPIMTRALRFGIKQNTKTATIPYEFLLGMRHLSIESNVYENVSFICLKFPVPEGKTAFSEIVPNWITDGSTSVYVYKTEAEMKAVSNNSDVGPGWIFNSSAPEPLLPADPILVDGADNLYLLFKMNAPTAIASTPILYGAKIRWA